MASADFINLDSSSESDQDDGPETLEHVPSGEVCQNSISEMNESADDTPAMENFEAFEKNGGKEGTQCIHYGVTEVSSIQEQPILEKSIDLVQSVVTLEKVNGAEANADSEKGCCVMPCTTNISKSCIDESPIKGMKRPRTSFVEEGPFIRVVYNSLTRESKKKLMELMQHWSEWHAQNQTSSSESSKEALESGEETYFPALDICAGGPSTVSFWIDNKAGIKETTDIKLDDDTVPLYDRGYTLVSTSVDGLANFESGVRTKEASRCFNCGSYSHSLKECPKPRDNVAISNARKLHNEKRNAASGSHGQTRYYVKVTGKFDDLKPGVVGPETREALGIGEFDPPPWLNRMRELGYPPGYLDIIEDEDQPSGIIIFADEEIKEEDEDEGELPEKVEPAPPEKRKTVEFPGINAPIPGNADQRRWDPQPSGSYGSSSYKSCSSRGSNHSSVPNRALYTEHRRSSDFRDDGPPGSEHGLAALLPPYSPRFSANDHNIGGRSPSLGRSLSDRAYRSPLGYNSSPSHDQYGSYPYNSGATRWSTQHLGPYESSSDASQSRRGSPHEHRRHHSRK